MGQGVDLNFAKNVLTTEIGQGYKCQTLMIALPWFNWCASTIFGRPSRELRLLERVHMIQLHRKNATGSRSTSSSISHSWSPSDSRYLRKLMAVLLCAFFILAGHPLKSFGQAEQGTIKGRVVDVSGAAIRGAAVTASEVSTHTVTSSKSNDDGYYTIPYLDPGTYEVAANAPGFSTAVVSGIHLTVNLTASVNLELKVGAVSEKVTVEANAIQLETESPELGGTISRTQIIELPNLGRNIFNLILLEPGVMPDTGGLNKIINGGRANTSGVVVDGGSQVNSTTGDITFTPPLESVREAKLITNSFSAEYGRAGGGIVTASTASGSNQWHGSVYEYNRNTILNANGWYRNHVGLPRPEFKENNYGFTFGGPVVLPRVYDGHDKTFFFVNYERDGNVQPLLITGNVPTQAMRSGDFSGLVDNKGKPIAIFDPATTTLVSGTTNTYRRTQFPGNVIPPGRINNIAAKVLNYYPAPNAPGIFGIYNNYQNSLPRTTRRDVFLARGDQNIGTRHKVFLRVGRSNSESSNPTITLAYPQAGTNGNPGTFLSTSWTGVISDTWLVSPNIAAEFRGNFTRSLNQTKQPSQGFDASTLGFSSNFLSHIEVPIFPNFRPTDTDNIGADRAGTFTDAEGTDEGQASVTIVKGKHTIKTGLDYAFVYFNVTRPEKPAGQFTFDRTPTQGPNPVTASNNAGWGFATFLLGSPTGGQLSKDVNPAASQKYFDAYLQDDYKLTQKLTLNLGVRYDLLGPWTERYNRLAYFDPKALDNVTGTPGALQFVGVNGHPRGQRDTVYTNFSPRVGFAFQIQRDTVVRAAYGFFYLNGTGGIGGGATDLGQGFIVQTSVFNPSTIPNTPTSSLADPFSAGYLPSPSTLVGGDITDPYRTGTIPMNQHWNLSVQHQFGRQTTLTVAYAGNRGEHIWRDLPRNVAPIANLARGAQLTTRVPNPYAGKITGTLGQPTVSFAQLLLPFPQYTSVNWQRDPVGDSYYHAMTMQLQHQNSHGLFLQASYTLSKEIDDVNERFEARGNVIVDPNNLRRSRAVAEWDRPHYVIFNYVYNLPIGAGHRLGGRGLTSKLIGNWQVSGITSYGVGLPIVITAPSSTFLPGITAVANRLHDPHLKSGQTPFNWFDTTAYQAAAPFTTGNGNRVEPDLRGPTLGNWDIGIQRKQKLSETVDLALKGEFFNAFNNRALGGREGVPNGNVTSGVFGQVTNSGSPRNVQIGVRLSF